MLLSASAITTQLPPDDQELLAGALRRLLVDATQVYPARRSGTRDEAADALCAEVVPWLLRTGQ